MSIDNGTGKMRIWGCGGAGVNLAAHYYNHPAQDNFAEIIVGMVDTSRSNLSKLGNIADEDVYLVGAGTEDGAGKIRKDIHSKVVESLPEIMGKFNDGDFHVVLFSLSGGSGSVIGPLVLGELVKRGHSAVGIAIGSHESTLTAVNTVNTLRSLDNLARNTVKAPLVVAFHNNHENTKKDEVNAAVLQQISELALLVSRAHHGLDKSDIQSWLRFDRHSNNQAQLAIFDICDSVESVKEIPYPIGIASLLTGASDIGMIGADYFCDGRMTDEVSRVLNASELHYVINVTQVPQLFSVFQKAEQALRERNDSRPKHQGISHSTDADASGLVL